MTTVPIGRTSESANSKPVVGASPREIHFYAPGLKKFKTGEYSTQDSKAFVSVSVTGDACALKCEHCNTKVLLGMGDLRTERSLFQMCEDISARGARGVLVSGGSDREGRVPLLSHMDDLKRVRQELGLTIRVHPGLVSEAVAEGLADVGIDGAMVDIIGAEETIREVYHLDYGVEEYERTLERLSRHGVPMIPHIILGLHFGEFLGEERALELISQYPPKILVLVIFMPLYGTPMANVKPPAPETVGEFFLKARTAMPDTPVMLGCARPYGDVKKQIDRLAVDAGLDGIAYPAEGIVGYAEGLGFRPRFHDACCGVNW